MNDALFWIPRRITECFSIVSHISPQPILIFFFILIIVLLNRNEFLKKNISKQSRLSDPQTAELNIFFKGTFSPHCPELCRGVMNWERKSLLRWIYFLFETKRRFSRVPLREFRVSPRRILLVQMSASHWKKPKTWRGQRSWRLHSSAKPLLSSESPVCSEVQRRLRGEPPVRRNWPAPGRSVIPLEGTVSIEKRTKNCEAFCLFTPVNNRTSDAYWCLGYRMSWNPRAKSSIAHVVGRQRCVPRGIPNSRPPSESHPIDSWVQRNALISSSLLLLLLMPVWLSIQIRDEQRILHSEHGDNNGPAHNYQHLRWHDETIQTAWVCTTSNGTSLSMHAVALVVALVVVVVVVVVVAIVIAIIVVAVVFVFF